MEDNKTLIDLKEHFLPDTIIYGNTNMPLKKLKAFHSKHEKYNVTYILKSRISKIEDLLNHQATYFITNLDPTSEEQIALMQHDKVIVYNKNPRLQMAKVSSLFLNSKNLFDSSREDDQNKSTPIIGKGTMIHPNATIYPNVSIGENCIIHAGAVIGADGFGYEKDEDGSWFKIAHLGSVEIGNNVEIGANTCIDRGTLDNTIIEDGVKIDNLVHIAHNVHIKKNAVIIANAMIAGSVTIEEGAWIAPSSCVREGLQIGKNSLVGLGSVVTKSVPPETVVLGNPARIKV